MKNLIERALYTVGDIIDKQTYFTKVKSASKAPYTIEELKNTIPKNPNNIYLSFDIKNGIIEYISPNVFKLFNLETVERPDLSFFYNLFAEDYLDHFNKITESGFWFMAKTFSLKNLYKTKGQYIIKYKFPYDQIRYYLSSTYVQETNALGQMTKIHMIQTDISHWDFIDVNSMQVISLDSSLPTYRTTNFWNKYSKHYKPKLDLNTKDLKILQLFGDGLDNKNISQNLGLTEETIKGYRKEMLRKTERATMHELLADYILEDNNNFSLELT